VGEIFVAFGPNEKNALIYTTKASEFSNIKKSNEKKFCFYCKRENHIVEDCYSLKNKMRDKDKQNGPKYTNNRDTYYNNSHKIYRNNSRKNQTNWNNRNRSYKYVIDIRTTTTKTILVKQITAMSGIATAATKTTKQTILRHQFHQRPLKQPFCKHQQTLPLSTSRTTRTPCSTLIRLFFF
jgi:hypothetical protein